MTVLSRGAGGVPDVRSAIDGFEESAPLYGFVQYRRRKVVLSYLPEDLSRLVKGMSTCVDCLAPLVHTDVVPCLARTTVQFQSVLDKFSPHDTVFSLSKSSDLTESALSSACLLHAASGSITSSPSSLRRRRLMEITEDAEENATDNHDAQPQSPASEASYRPFSQRSDATVVAPTRTPSKLQHSTTSDNLQSSTESNTPELPSTSERPPSTAPSVTFDDSSDSPPSQKHDLYRVPSESRRLSQSSRLSVREDFASIYTPKVKRAPRPSVDSNGRPRTAGNLSRNQEPRPVASLPAGVRPSPLRKPGPNNPSRPRSQGSSVASSISKGTAPSVPSLLMPPLSIPVSKPQNASGAKSMSAVTTSGISPEKERLMKALQQRKKQMEKRSGQNKQNQPAATDRKGQDTDENKENRVGYRQPRHDQSTADRLAALRDKSRHGTEPSAAEPQSVFVTDSRKKTGPCVSSEQPNPDSAVDLVVSDSEGDQPSITSPPSTTPTTATTNTTATTLSVDHHNNDNDDIDEGNKAFREEQQDQEQVEDEDEKAQTPETPPIVETQPNTGAKDPLAVSEAAGVSRGPDGPRSPSAFDGPLKNKSRSVPKNNNEIVISPPPTEQPPDSEQEVDAATETPELIPTLDTPSIVRSSSIPIVSNDVDSLHELPAPESSDEVRQDATKRKSKRKPFLDHIHVPTPEYSDEDNFLSDDSFMEELKSATVQEAKPVSVGSPVFQSNGDDNDQVASSPEAWRESRAVSNPSTSAEPQLGNLRTATGGRSVSSTYLEANDPMSPALVARKVNVSSGISKRIKALEKFTGNQDVPATVIPPNSAGTTSSSPLDAFRKRASISKESRNSESPLISRSPSYSIEQPLPQSPDISRGNSQSSLNNAPQTANSVSVTARIIRDEDGSSPNGYDPNTLNLQASPLTVEHGTSEVPVAQSLSPEPGQEKREIRSLSTSSAGSANQAAAISRSESRMSNSSQTKGEGDDKVDKRSSRTSRIFSRMSSITSNSRRSFLGALSPSPSVKKEQDDISPSEEKEPDPAPEQQAVDVGEVNVQFPDTLLWKRRFIRIDDKGYLVLAPANVDSTGRNMTKRYHMTEFRTPCLPDEDRQELPNSILLDFLDGSTLQCACESRQGQSTVLESKSTTSIDLIDKKKIDSLLTISSQSLFMLMAPTNLCLDSRHSLPHRTNICILLFFHVYLNVFSARPLLRILFFFYPFFFFDLFPFCSVFSSGIPHLSKMISYPSVWKCYISYWTISSTVSVFLLSLSPIFVI